MSDDGPTVMESFEHAGDDWELRIDSVGRAYGARVGYGKVPVETVKRAKNNDPLSNFEK